MAKGDGLSDISWFLLVMSGLAVVWWLSGGMTSPGATAGLFLTPPAPLGTGEYYGIGQGDGDSRLGSANDDGNGETLAAGGRSPWAGQVRLNPGTARYEYLPGKEYVILEADYGNAAPINVSGWWLKNGKDERIFVVGGREVFGVSDWVRLPLARELFVGGESGAPQDPLMLAAGGRVVITTGVVSARNPYPIGVSFRVNRCSGYLDDDPRRFTPPLYTECPSPRAESDLRRLDDDCFDFVEGLAACHAPEFDEDADGNDYVDGRRLDLSRHCRAYLTERFNYNTCIARERGEPDFWTDEWRVFLGRSFELWDENREVITLLDSEGRVVDEYRY